MGLDCGLDVKVTSASKLLQSGWPTNGTNISNTISNQLTQLIIQHLGSICLAGSWLRWWPWQGQGGRLPLGKLPS